MLITPGMCGAAMLKPGWTGAVASVSAKLSGRLAVKFGFKLAPMPKLQRRALKSGSCVDGSVGFGKHISRSLVAAALMQASGLSSFGLKMSRRTKRLLSVRGRGVVLLRALLRAW